jgi:hypothetical protein
MSKPLLKDGKNLAKKQTLAVSDQAPVYKRLRILITGCNSLVGHSLFQDLRNDDVMINTVKKPHEFLGTLVKRDANFVPVPSETIICLDN